MRHLVSKLLFTLLLSFSIFAWSLPSDRDQPIEIEADHAQLDDEQGITQYKGKAVLTQGTLRIEGDIITFYYDDDKQITKAIAQGKRAHYQQVQNPGEKPVKAKAYQMEYHAKSQKIYLVGKGQVWQQDGEFKGERIEYDIARNIVNASGRTKQTVAGKPAKKERIHIILQPPARTKKSDKKQQKKTPLATKATQVTAKAKPKSVPAAKQRVEPEKPATYPEAISTANLNIRTGPSTEYQKLATLRPRTKLFVLTEQKNWVQVRAENKGEPIIGWVDRRFIMMK